MGSCHRCHRRWWGTTRAGAGSTGGLSSRWTGRGGGVQAALAASDGPSAGAKKHKNNPSEGSADAVVQARRDLAAEKLAEHIRQIVEAASPPLRDAADPGRGGEQGAVTLTAPDRADSLRGTVQPLGGVADQLDQAAVYAAVRSGAGGRIGGCSTSWFQ